MHKLKAIVDPNHEIDYEKVRDPALVDTIKVVKSKSCSPGAGPSVVLTIALIPLSLSSQSCVCRDPKRRATISGEGGLLSDPYLHPESVKVSHNKT